MVRNELSDEVKRMVLQLERDVVARARLRQVLTAADSTVADDRVELRALKARLKRTPAKH